MRYMNYNEISRTDEHVGTNTIKFLLSYIFDDSFNLLDDFLIESLSGKEV